MPFDSLYWRGVLSPFDSLYWNSKVLLNTFGLFRNQEPVISIALTFVKMAVNIGFSKVWLVFNVMCLLMETLRFATGTATQLKVGDDSAWTIGPNYATWAANKEIHPGDSLLFKYSNTFHDVLQVTKSDYDSCKSDSPLATYKSGNDIVSLSKTGSYYYLCGFPGHCAAGQKVAVVVFAATTPPHSAPSHAPSPSPLAPASNKSKSATSPSPSPIQKSLSSPSLAPKSSPSPLAPAPKKSKHSPSPSPLAPAAKKSKHSPSPSPAHKSLPSLSPAPESSYTEKAGPSPSKALNSTSTSSSSSKTSAHKLSSGLMWASLVLFFIL